MRDYWKSLGVLHQLAPQVQDAEESNGEEFAVCQVGKHLIFGGLHRSPVFSVAACWLIVDCAPALEKATFGRLQSDPGLSVRYWVPA